MWLLLNRSSLVFYPAVPCNKVTANASQLRRLVTQIITVLVKKYKNHLKMINTLVRLTGAYSQ